MEVKTKWQRFVFALVHPKKHHQQKKPEKIAKKQVKKLEKEHKRQLADLKKQERHNNKKHEEQPKIL